MTVTVVGTVAVETTVDCTVTVTVCGESVDSIIDEPVEGFAESPGPPVDPLSGPPVGPAFGPFPGSAAGPFGPLGVVARLVPAGAGASFDGRTRVATST